MNYRLSKLAKTIIIINIVLTIILAGIHSYNVYRYTVTNNMIYEVIAEQDVDRETAIEILELDGEKLLLGGEIWAGFGLVVTLMVLALLYKYATTNGFLWGMFAATTCVFSTFIGGFLLFYVILSGKSEHNNKPEPSLPRNDWEKFIHEKA